MTITASALQIIKAFEGLRLNAYRDPVGIPTIGYGHTSAAGVEIRYTDGTRSTEVIMGKSIGAYEADRLKAVVLQKFENQIRPMMDGATVTPNEWGAIVSLAYNIGPGAFKRSSVLKRLKAGDKAGAADAFLMWNKAGGKVLPGLVRRRKSERALFLGNEQEALTIADIKASAPIAPPPLPDVEPTEMPVEPTEPPSPTPVLAFLIALAAVALIVSIALMKG